VRSTWGFSFRPIRTDKTGPGGGSELCGGEWTSVRAGGSFGIHEPASRETLADTLARQAKGVDLMVSHALNSDADGCRIPEVDGGPRGPGAVSFFSVNDATVAGSVPYLSQAGGLRAAAGISFELIGAKSVGRGRAVHDCAGSWEIKPGGIHCRRPALPASGEGCLLSKSPGAPQARLAGKGRHNGISGRH